MNIKGKYFSLYILKVAEYEYLFKVKTHSLIKIFSSKDRLRSFYANRYSNYMLDKSTFLARLTTISIILYVLVLFLGSAL